MAKSPINNTPKLDPFNMNAMAAKYTSRQRAEDEAIAVSVTTDTPVEDVQEQIEAGNTTIIRDTKRAIDQKTSDSFGVIVESAYEQGFTPDATTQMLDNEAEKRRQFYSTGDNLYFDQAIGLGDATVSAESTRFATNLQIGQEIFEAEISAISEDTSWAGYAADFVDRYLLRAFPIGGFEQVTNRNERKGRELLEAAATMEPQQYEQFIRAYIHELKEEGVFVSENIFALMDGYSEFENAGYDDSELINRTLGVVDLTPVLAAPKLVRATTPLRRIAALKGPDAAADAGEAILRNGPTSNPRIVNDMKPDALDPGQPPRVIVPANRDVRIVNENAIIREVTDITSRGGLGQDTASSAAKRAYEEAIGTLRKAANNPVVNVRNPLRLDATGNLRMNLTLGTVKTGRPYGTKASAEKMAKKIREEFPTAQVRQVDPDNDEMGFYIEIEDVLDTSKFADEVSSNAQYDGLRTALGRVMASKSTTESEELNDLATIAEGVASAIGGGRAMRDVTRALNSVPTEQQRVISRVFAELRDGKDAFMREHYTDLEFADKYKQMHPRGEAPTQREIDAFHAARTVSDAAYMLRAHLRMQKYIRNGYYGVTMPDGTRVAGRVTDEALGDEAIFDVQQGTVFRKRDLHPKSRVWELDRELEGGVRYIVNPSEVRALSHSDVLGYNAGGRRINPNANYFVVLGNDAPRAFLTTVTEEQARIAKSQIENIQAVVRESGDIASNTRVLDEVVRANNDWNPELQSFKDFSEFAKEKKLDFTKPVEFKSRDGEIRTGEVRDFFSSNWDEYVTFNMHRSDDTLVEFGGKEAMNYDPINAMFRDFGSISQHFAHNVYTQTALNSWLKAARRKGSGWDVPPTSDPMTAFTRATKAEATNKRAAELGRQHAIIKQRLGMKSEVFRHMESYGAELQEFVFDKSKGLVQLSRDPAKGAAQNSLNVGFQSAFGFGNISQFFVQGYHALTIAAMTQRSLIEAGSGLKALAMAPATRMILLGAKDAATEKEMIARLAKWAGQTVDEMTETIDYIRTSGRDILDGSMVEHGTGAQWGLSGWKGESFLPSKIKDAQRGLKGAVGGALKAGLLPFREGERMSRLTGINAAILEYRAAFPGHSLNTAHARKWVTRREQALSFRMTNANRALMQEGFGKLPTQWFTYTLRAMENVAIGRDLTVGERVRMSLALFPAFGLTGMGAAAATDWVAERVGAEPAGTMYNFIKRGMLDTLIEGASGGTVEVALAERLAPITLLQDVFRNVEGAKAPWEIALGPSGDIISNILGSVINVGGEIVNGSSVALTEDVVRVARQVSGVDNVFKAIGIYQNGVYRSRTGKTLPLEMDASDAVGQLLGFSPREVSDWYQEKGWSYQDSRKLRDFQTGLENEFSRAMEIWDSGDKERAIKYIKELEYKIIVSGFSPYDQQRLRRGLRRTVDRTVYNMIMDYYRRENTYRAEVLEETFGG